MAKEIQTSNPVGIILLNLGSPDAPEPKPIRRFLAIFLADKRVIQLPRLVWLPILYCFILPFRPKKLAPLYKTIWGDGEGPIRSIGKKIAGALQATLNCPQKQYGSSFQVESAMTYGNPSISAALSKLAESGCEHTIVLPLFPQFSDTTTSAGFDALERALEKVSINSTLHFIEEYHSNPLYIKALTQQIKSFAKSHKIDLTTPGNNAKLLMSFHGIPKSYADKGDPYPQQCENTARLLTSSLNQELKIPEERCVLSYQSRFGKAEWLKPYTDCLLGEWGNEKLDNVCVICPGFSVDCLETLEEIAIQNKEGFENAGGKNYYYIPALNDNSEHIELLADLVCKKVAEIKGKTEKIRTADAD